MACAALSERLRGGARRLRAAPTQRHGRGPREARPHHHRLRALPAQPRARRDAAHTSALPGARAGRHRALRRRDRRGRRQPRCHPRHLPRPRPGPHQRPAPALPLRGAAGQQPPRAL
eukprot:scaffold108483_cov48-Phaeocystis_antarctica.AAC.1